SSVCAVSWSRKGGRTCGRSACAAQFPQRVVKTRAALIRRPPTWQRPPRFCEWSCCPAVPGACGSLGEESLSASPRNLGNKYFLPFERGKKDFRTLHKLGLVCR